jgi:murein DD-endopeptidase MepM/ murein hydrolase activator NlpD
LQAVYQRFFGYPFLYAIEPLLPENLQQPPFQLPFQPDKVWAYTGGPHAGWADGSAWAALDFAPPGDALGCVKSDEWVTAVADGPILRASDGAVIQDLDGDGLEQTGWVVLYMHIESRGRVKPGEMVRMGEKIGHPSCEGGVSDGTHVHLARRYNGEWISADRDLPFNLDGWISSSAGKEYDGYLTRGEQQIEAYVGREAINSIQR